MRSYTVHLPKGASASDPAAFEQAILLRDGFSWGAFLLTALWLLWRGAALAALLVAVGLVGAWWGLSQLPVDEGARALALGLLAFLVGLEGTSLVRWTYRRRGLSLVDVVAAPDRATAEAIASARAVARARATAGPSLAALAPSRRPLPPAPAEAAR